MTETMIDSRTGQAIAIDALTELPIADRCPRCAGPLEDARYGLCWTCWLYGDTDMEDQR